METKYGYCPQCETEVERVGNECKKCGTSMFTEKEANEAHTWWLRLPMEHCLKLVEDYKKEIGELDDADVVEMWRGEHGMVGKNEMRIAHAGAGEPFPKDEIFRHLKSFSGLGMNINSDRFILPEQYTPIEMPHYRGDGAHSIKELQKLCRLFTEYCHQQAVIKQELIKAVKHDSTTSKNIQK